MKNSKSLKVKVIATVLASVCAVSAVGVVSASANDGMGKSSNAQQRISYQNTVRYNTPFEYKCYGATSYGYDWTYSIDSLNVTVDCDYNFSNSGYTFHVKGVEEGYVNAVLMYVNMQEQWVRVPMKLYVDKNLNVSKASVKDNANIELNSTFYHEGETFYVEPTGDGKYKITSFCSGGKALTAGWGEDGKGYANVKQAEYKGDSAQQWYIRVSKKNKDYVTISSSNDQNYVLNAAGTSNGSNVNLVLSSGEKAQRWKLVPAADPNGNALAAGTYKIRNVAAQKRVIAVDGRVSGANVTI